VSDKTAELGVYGPGARAEAVPPGLDALDYPLGRHVVGDAAAVRAYADALVRGGAARLTAEAAEVMRVERGVSAWGAEIKPDEHLPLEQGLDDAVSHTKGCYVGQEPVARVTARGHVNHKIVGLELGAPAQAGAVVSTPERPEAGVVTSAVVSQTLGRPIALARLHRSLWEPGTRVVVAGAGEATVAALPFIPVKD
jgi:aminomethyltransferase